jgi:hypothetical protein
MTKRQKSTSGMEKDLRLYSPSWVDRITDWVRRLPGRSFAYYFGLGVFLFLLQTVVSWIEGAPLFGPFSLDYFFFAVALPYILGMIHMLDDRASSAFETMKPVLSISEDESKSLRYKLTVLPIWPTIIASILAIALAILSEVAGRGAYRLATLQAFPLSDDLFRVIYLICWWFFGAFLYHTAHQLVIINRVYTRHTKINLFRMKPLYAFSNLTALTAGSLIVPPYGFLMLNRDEISFNEPVVLGTYVLITSIAVVTFIYPQLGIHRLQKSEKGRLLEEAKQRYEITIAELHQSVDEKNYDGMTNLSMAMGSLEKEIRMVGKIPTWPWQPETLRWLITALVLPLGLWLVQFLLQRMLEG